MRFVCSACGHTVAADGRPEGCPACEAPASAFWSLDGDAEALVVARSDRPRRRLLRALALAGALCLIATPLDDELARSPVARADGDGAPVRPAVAPPEWRPPPEDPVVSEIDRFAPGTMAAWRKDAGPGVAVPPADPSGGMAGGAGTGGAGTGGAGTGGAGTGGAGTGGAGTGGAGTGGGPAAAPGPASAPRDAAGRQAAAGGLGSAPTAAGGGDGAGGGRAGTGCPPEPDPPRSVVFVVDASVSMGLPVDIPVEVERMLDARIDAGDQEARSVYRQLMAGPSPKRLDFAKRVFAAAIDRIPPGFDAGLVSFRSCTRIDGIGPVKPADFGELRKHVEALAVQRGGDTAITESLSHARRLLSGTGGRVVLVTDGQETCRRDPCAVHGDIADDGIVVDVVDLTGVAALECLAGSSGGQVYRARGRLDVAELTGFVSAAMERACRGE